MTSSYILESISDSASPLQQAKALRLLKNDVVGNDTKKAAWKEVGIFQLLTDVLKTSLEKITQQCDRQRIILQIVSTVGALANGDASFVASIEASQTYASLIHVLRLEHANSTISNAVLRTLNYIANTISAHMQLDTDYDQVLGSVLYSDSGVTTLRTLLQEDDTGTVSEKKIELVARLLTKTCTNDTRRDLVQASGILDILAARLAGLAGLYLRRIGSGSLTTPAHTFKIHSSTANGSHVSVLLQAAATIMQGSGKRSRYLLEKATGFIGTKELTTTGPSAHDTYGSSEKSQSYVPPGSERGDDDLIFENTKDPDPSRYPFDAISRRQKRLGPFMQWILHVAKAGNTFARLMAIWVAVLLVRCGQFSRKTELSVVSSFIPTLVHMLQPQKTLQSCYLHYFREGCQENADMQIWYEAPRILASLMDEEPLLQEAAHEAGATFRLVQLLRQCSETIHQKTSDALWNPFCFGSEVKLDRQSPEVLLSEAAIPLELQHRWRIRQTTLRAIAAIASRRDDYRKAVVDQAAVPLLVNCLKPLNQSALRKKSQSVIISDMTHDAGNPTNVLLAACEATKALCRSVGTLRTSLSDANLASPLASLLNHSSVDVQIAATAAVCNIVLEYSPMRQAAVEAGILHTLCNHALSSNLKLRQNSLWALKHIVHSAPNSLKIDCLSRLGNGWLTETLAPLSINVGQTKLSRQYGDNSPSSTYNFTNANEDSDEVQMIEEQYEGHIVPGSFVSGSDKEHSNFFPSEKATNINNADGNKLHTNSEDWSRCIEELAVREQGLDFVRNIISGRDNHEMADCILREVGSDRLVDNLAGLLSTYPDNWLQNGGRSMECVQLGRSLLVTILSIICNLAGALPRHRQLIISNSRLLGCMIPLFRHPHAEVRKTCVWTVINLTWMDDQEDRLNCRSRAFELRKVGILEQLTHLVNDSDLDVRERTKTAVSQLNKQLDC